MRSVIIIIFIIISCAAALFVYYYCRNQHQSAAELVIADTVYIPYAIHDTLKVRVYRISADKNNDAEKLIRNGMAVSSACSDSCSSGTYGHNFLALADTAYKDSLLTLRLGFLSPLPVHPDSRFIIDLSYRKMVVNRQIHTLQAAAHPGKLHFSLNLGLGFGLIHGRTDIFAGAGISYSF